MDTITIKDIARICGVGVSTVSRAINNHPDINEETKQMVMKVIKENNFVPNNSARNLKRTDSKTIAVLIKGIGNPFFNNAIKVFEEETQKKKYSFILQRVKDRDNEVDLALELLKEKKLKGIIFLGGFFVHSEEKLARLNVPFVLSTIGVPKEYQGTGYSSVAIDDTLESFKIVDYLCEMGHKKIAIIAAPEDDQSIGRLRLEGYRNALEERGISLDPDLICRMKEDIDTYTMENGYTVTKELLSSKREFTALYAISDSVAIGACKAIFDAGLRVPEDYSVAGFDGLEMAHYYQPSITTVKQPVEDMARATIKLLFEQIKKKSGNRHVVFPAELVVGQSTREK